MTTDITSIRAHNSAAWDRAVANGSEWTIPVTSEEVAAAQRGHPERTAEKRQRAGPTFPADGIRQQFTGMGDDQPTGELQGASQGREGVLPA